MIQRPPHVCRDQGSKTTSDEVKKNWEKIKNKKQLLSGGPENLPALLKAFRIGEKCANVGFDWKNSKDAFLKVLEEMDEVREADLSGKKDLLEEEIGDLLFAVSSFARLSGLEPETCLRKALKKFQIRFEKIEPDLKNCQNLEEMEELWQKSK